MNRIQAEFVRSELTAGGNFLDECSRGAVDPDGTVAVAGPYLGMVVRGDYSVGAGGGGAAVKAGEVAVSDLRDGRCRGAEWYDVDPIIRAVAKVIFTRHLIDEADVEGGQRCGSEYNGVNSAEGFFGYRSAGHRYCHCEQ